MKTIVAILALAFFAVGPVAAKSETFVPPGHHMKGTHGQPGASYWAPGHQKRLFNQTNARRVAPGRMK
jgi:hypothetical protein